jgi:hypothetical protein
MDTDFFFGAWLSQPRFGGRLRIIRVYPWLIPRSATLCVNPKSL